ncbi:MAG: hypothetical protein LIO55_06025 [Oscillospiraceae bacterium]|nr:hypothetical protein [Oscillospiraceae bacterium]
MKYKKFFLLLPVIACCIVAALVGCTSGGTQLAAREVTLDSDHVLSYLALLDDSVVYLSSDETGVICVRHYLDNGTSVPIGKLENFYLRTKNAVLIDNSIYFFVSVLTGDTQSKNILACIDLSENELKYYEKQDASIAGLVTAEFGKNVVTYKNEVNGASVTTYVDMFSVDSGEWVQYHESRMDTDSYEGTAIHGIYGNGHLYLLQDESRDSGFVTSVIEYDEQMQFVREIVLDDAVKAYILQTGRITEMAVWDDYIYFRNISNYAMIGHIEDGTVTPLLQAQNMELALNQTDTDDPLFYQRRTNTYYVLDRENCTVSARELTMADASWSIRSILKNTQAVLVICQCDGKPDFLYYLPEDSMGTAVIPCESSF